MAIKRLYGIDYILGGNYLRTLNHHPNGWAAGFLWNVSGVKGSKKAIIKLAKSGRCPRIRVSLLWHDSHRFSDADKEIIQKRARALAKIVNDYPDIEWYCQPMLEPHRASDRLTTKLLRTAKRELPKSVKMVTGNNYGGPKVVRETHHSYSSWPKQKIFSFDGKDARDSYVKSWDRNTQDCKTFFLWTSNCNGNKRGEKLPRKDRKDWLTPEQLREMVAMVK